MGLSTSVTDVVIASCRGTRTFVSNCVLGDQYHEIDPNDTGFVAGIFGDGLLDCFRVARSLLGFHISPVRGFSKSLLAVDTIQI